jgi:hypothetical protein
MHDAWLEAGLCVVSVHDAGLILCYDTMIGVDIAGDVAPLTAQTRPNGRTRGLSPALPVVTV